MLYKRGCCIKDKTYDMVFAEVHDILQFFLLM